MSRAGGSGARRWTPRGAILLAVVSAVACGDTSRRPRIRDAGAAPPDAARDSGFDAGLDAGTDSAVRRDAGFDAGTDGAVRRDAAGFDAGFDSGSDAGFDAGFDAGTDAGTGPLGRGVYRYRRIPVGGLEAVHVAEFHPDGTYAVILEQGSGVHVYDWATETATAYDLDPPGSPTVRWEDFAFDPSGTFGVLVGTLVDGSSRTGVVYHFDDGAYRAGMPTPFSERVDARRPGADFVAIAHPHEPGLPIVLSRNGAFPWNAAIRRYDPAVGDFGSFIAATATSAGCDDVAFVNNEFGGEGVALVCGSGGADAPYWTEIGGVGEWRPAPTATLGNTSRIDARPGGSYALAIGWSGRRVHRFQDGAWRPASSAPWLRTRGIWGVAFQQEGQRALVVGQAQGTPLVATVLEYRHDLWSEAEITDVSIAGFDAAPYNGDSSWYLYDAAFRPGCDGGVIVGGKTSFRGSVGMLVEFQIEGGRDCDAPILD